MSLVQFSITPMGVGDSTSEWIVRAVDVVHKSGLRYQVGPTSTVIEGPWHEVSQVLEECLEVVSRDCERVKMSVEVDHRRMGEHDIEGAVQAVAQHFGHHVGNTSEGSTERAAESETTPMPHLRSQHQTDERHGDA